MNFSKLLNLFFAVILLLASCSKEVDEPDYNEENLADLSLEFDNIVGGQKLILNNVNYRSAAGETYNIQLLQYFISNIKLKKADGTEYIVPQDSSYFLITADDVETRFAKVKVPAGDYTSVTFILGVDSLRSTMDISRRTGVLDPAGGMDGGMYWGWNSGYIFFKMEGISTAAPVDPTGQHKYRFHIGGFGGYSAPTINNIKTITKDLTERGIAQVRAGRRSNIHFMVDIGKVLSGANTISLATHPQVMFSDFSVNVANNFTDMFTHDHTEN